MPLASLEADAEILGRLRRLGDLANAGYAVPLHFRFQAATYLFQTYPAAWTEAYSSGGMVMGDPVVRWGLTHVGVVTWAELEADDEAGVLAQARAHGLAYGVAISFDRGGSRSFAVLARHDRPFTAEETSEAQRLAEELHDLTANAGPLSAATRDELRRLSVAFTHP